MSGIFTTHLMTENKIHIMVLTKDWPTKSTSTIEEDRGTAQAIAHKCL